MKKNPIKTSEVIRAQAAFTKAAALLLEARENLEEAGLAEANITMLEILKYADQVVKRAQKVRDEAKAINAQKRGEISGSIHRV